MRSTLFAAIGLILITYVTNLSALSFGRSSVDKNAKLANLVDYEMHDGYITIQVYTAGCTGSNSFKIVADGQKENTLKVLRLKQDECGMKLRPIRLQYSIRHLGMDVNHEINILNPVQYH